MSAQPSHPETHTQIHPSPKLLALLVCPITKTNLNYNAAAQELVSEAAGLAFPIRAGVPILLVAEARKLAD